jgi:hypothetical protein
VSGKLKRLDEKVVRVRVRATPKTYEPSDVASVEFFPRGIAFRPTFHTKELSEVMPEGGYVVSFPRSVMGGRLLVFYLTRRLKVAAMFSSSVLVPR